jgi:hypothetical protein
VDAPQKLHFVFELCGGEGGVASVVSKVCSSLIGCGEEVAMFGDVVEGKCGGGEAELPCICFENGVD